MINRFLGMSLRFEAYSCPGDLKRIQKDLCKLIGVGEIDSDQLLQSSKQNKFNLVQVHNPLDSALNKALQLQSAAIRLRAIHTEESVLEETSAVESKKRGKEREVLFLLGLFYSCLVCFCIVFFGGHTTRKVLGSRRPYFARMPKVCRALWRPCSPPMRTRMFLKRSAALSILAARNTLPPTNSISLLGSLTRFDTPFSFFFFSKEMRECFSSGDVSSSCA